MTIPSTPTDRATSPGGADVADAPARVGTRIEFRNVSKSFTHKGTTTNAVDNVSLTIEPGEIVGIIGYSGAGKSTLVRLINGLEKPTSGEIVLDGENIAALPERKLRSIRRRIGMIFQQFNLMNSRTAAGNVEFPLALAKVNRAQRAAKVAQLLEFVDLADKGKNYPDQLSGGQKQRIGIARALATDPSLLLADEATSALDPETTHDVLALLRKVNRELGITIVVITHEMDVVRSIADRVVVMEQGRIVEQGLVHEVFSNPQQAITQRFVATALRDTPDTHEVSSIHSAQADAKLPAGAVRRCITVRVGDGVDISPLFVTAAGHGVEVDVVHGAVNTIQRHSFGRLTVRLTGPSAGVEAVITRVGEISDWEELDA